MLEKRWRLMKQLDSCLFVTQQKLWSFSSRVLSVPAVRSSGPDRLHSSDFLPFILTLLSFCSSEPPKSDTLVSLGSLLVLLQLCHVIGAGGAREARVGSESSSSPLKCLFPLSVL